LETLKFSLLFPFSLFSFFTRRVLPFSMFVCVYLQFRFVVVFATAILCSILCVLWSYTHTYQREFPFCLCGKFPNFFAFPIWNVFFVSAKIKENAKSERPAAATTKLFLAPLPHTFSCYRFLSLTCLFLSLVSTRKINEKSNNRSAVVIRQAK